MKNKQKKKRKQQKDEYEETNSADVPVANS
jgi:hypothetical protein